MRTSEIRHQEVENKARLKFSIDRKDYSPFICTGGRNDLATLFAELGYSVGAEIGVYQGEYSLELCKAIPNLKLTCVDSWAGAGRRFSPGRMERNYQHCVGILSPYNAVFMRMTSVEAAKLIPDNSLDFVYIDASHYFKDVMMDIILWEPKVRPSGIISGHDYIHLPRFGVIEAVNAFVNAYNIRNLFITQPDPTSCSPSWFWVK